MKRVGLALLACVLLIGVVYALGPRVDVGDPEAFDPPPPLTGLTDWLAEREARQTDLTPGAEARIIWADPTAPARTPLSIVQMHGFSASPVETSPFGETVAAALGANLYMARLRGHGRGGEALAEATVEQWYADALEGLAIGRTLGERVVLIGTSTGGSLAVWLAARPEAAEAIEALVLVSPNLGLADARGALLTGPWGRQLAEAFIGETREWTPESEGRRTYWTWRYPTRALLPMMALVDVVSALPPGASAARTLVFYSPLDPVVDAGATAAWVAAAGNRTAVVVDDDLPHGNHVLVGDIVAPQRTERLARRAIEFVNGPSRHEEP